MNNGYELDRDFGFVELGDAVQRAEMDPLTSRCIGGPALFGYAGGTEAGFDPYDPNASADMFLR